MPGLPGPGKRAGAKQKPQQKKGKRVSGDPAKRAAEAAAAKKSDGASAFGFPAGGKDDFELPQELKDLM